MNIKEQLAYGDLEKNTRTGLLCIVVPDIKYTKQTWNPVNLRSFIDAVGRQSDCPRDASWGMGSVLRTKSHYYSILLNFLSVKRQVVWQ